MEDQSSGLKKKETVIYICPVMSWRPEQNFPIVIQAAFNKRWMKGTKTTLGGILMEGLHHLMKMSGCWGVSRVEGDVWGKALEAGWAVLGIDWYFLQRKGCCWKCHAVGVADGDRMKLSVMDEKLRRVFLRDFDQRGNWTRVLVIIEADGGFRAVRGASTGKWKLQQH